MAQPLPSEPPRLPEAPDLTVSDPDAQAERPPVRLLQEPPERKVTGPRPRPGLRKPPVVDQTPLPARGAGMTITSYLIAGLLAYGLIGWLIGRAVHLEILTAVGMLIGLGISMALIIYRYGRSTPPRIYRFAPKPAATPEPNEQNGPMTTQRDQKIARADDARGTDR
jgi:ATP synthase protein I